MKVKGEASWRRQRWWRRSTLLLALLQQPHSRQNDMRECAREMRWFSIMKFQCFAIFGFTVKEERRRAHTTIYIAVFGIVGFVLLRWWWWWVHGCKSQTTVIKRINNFNFENKQFRGCWHARVCVHRARMGGHQTPKQFEFHFFFDSRFVSVSPSCDAIIVCTMKIIVSLFIPPCAHTNCPKL